MTEAEKRTHRVCFTGHRPEKLTRNERAIKKDLEKGRTRPRSNCIKFNDIFCAKFGGEIKVQYGKMIKTAFTF